MGKQTPFCQQMHEKIFKIIKSIVPGRKIGMDLYIFPSMVHNIIQLLKNKEYGKEKARLQTKIHDLLIPQTSILEEPSDIADITT